MHAPHAASKRSTRKVADTYTRSTACRTKHSRQSEAIEHQCQLNNVWAGFHGTETMQKQENHRQQRRTNISESLSKDLVSVGRTHSGVLLSAEVGST